MTELKPPPNHVWIEVYEARWRFLAFSSVQPNEKSTDRFSVVQNKVCINTLVTKWN